MTFHKSLCLFKLFRNFLKKCSKQSLDMSKSRKSSWYLLKTSFMNPSYYNLALSDSFDAKCLFSYNLSMTLVNILLASTLLLNIFCRIKLPSEQKKTYLRGDLYCSFKTVFFSITEQNSLSFNSYVGLVLDDAKSILVAVGSLTVLYSMKLSFF